jgi:hypothetical protein
MHFQFNMIQAGHEGSFMTNIDKREDEANNPELE